MFLHVAVLGPFTDNIFRMFEAAAPGKNVCIGYARDDSATAQLMAARASSVPEVLEIIQSRGPWDGLTLNGLSDTEMVDLAAGIPSSLKCAWYVWGYESYSRALRLRRRLLKPLTRAAVRVPSPSLKAAIGGRVRLVHRDVHDWLRPPFDRFDFCVSQSPEEYMLFRKSGVFKATQYHWGAVGCLEDYVDVTSPITALGANIQLGNSATASMNHLDALDVIAACAPPGSRVVVPLSYGDQSYGDTVVNAGVAALGARFVPLRDFVPLSDYNSIMQSCGVVVMNQMRQQALGNIVSAIWRGAIVYMNDTSVYRTMRRLGVDVRLFESQFQQDAAAGFIPLSVERVELHRDILRAHQGRERVLRETRSLLDALAQGDC